MQKTCVKCGHVNPTATGNVTDACPKCGAIYAKLDALAQNGQAVRPVRVPTEAERDADARHRAALAADSRLAWREKVEEARRTGRIDGLPAEAINQLAAAIVVTTTSFVPRREITDIVGVVAHERAHAYGAIYEEFAGLLRNIVGSGRSSATTQLLQSARTEIMAVLRGKALGMGAQAVIDLRFDYEEFSGANAHGIVVIVGTGTAVRLADLAAQ